MSVFKHILSVLGKPDAAPAAPVVETPQPTERRRKKRVGSHKGRRVLIIDDSATITAALGKILRSAGCIAIEAADAEKGLLLLSSEKPDLVFLDIVLPGMNGFAALRLMRRDPVSRDVPVIMISGNEQATEQFYAKRIGADDFMKKPFSRHEVFARIEGLIERGKLKRIPVPNAESTPNAGPATQAAVAAASSANTESAAATTTASVTPLPTARDSIAVPGAAPVGVPPLRKIFSRDAGSASGTPGNTFTAASLEARKQLTAMGLQYFSQDQFLSAIHRWDELAIGFFIAGGGVDTNVIVDGKTLRELAQARRHSHIIALLERKATA